MKKFTATVYNKSNELVAYVYSPEDAERLIRDRPAYIVKWRKNILWDRNEIVPESRNIIAIDYRVLTILERWEESQKIVKQNKEPKSKNKPDLVETG